MENNNTPRKARIYYESESIPVLVEAENGRTYQLLLDWGTVIQEKYTSMDMDALRNKYLDALWGYEGAGQDQQGIDTALEELTLYKDNLNVTLVFDEPEQEDGAPTEMTEPDNVVPFPKVAKLTELDKQLNLMAHLNYEVKSWDISFPEDGEPQLYATFTKVEEVHPF